MTVENEADNNVSSVTTSEQFNKRAANLVACPVRIPPRAQGEIGPPEPTADLP